jgi:hypothetical protein
VRLIALAAVAASCSGSPPPPATPIAAPKTAAAPPASSFPSGSFRVTGRAVTDRCEGIRFASERLELDLESKVLSSDFEDRRYDVVIDGEELVARGAFDKMERCGTHQYLEIWRLGRAGDDEISGYLTTYVRQPERGNRSCLRACKVVFEVEAVRVKEAEGEGEGEEQD